MISLLIQGLFQRRCWWAPFAVAGLRLRATAANFAGPRGSAREPAAAVPGWFREHTDPDQRQHPGRWWKRGHWPLEPPGPPGHRYAAGPS